MIPHAALDNLYASLDRAEFFFACLIVLGVVGLIAAWREMRTR